MADSIKYPFMANEEYIYSEDKLREYMAKFGVSYDALYEKGYEDCSSYCTSGDDWELIADGYYQNMMACRNELFAIADILLSGRGMTKAVAADTIKKICDMYLQ